MALPMPSTQTDTAMNRVASPTANPDFSAPVGRLALWQEMTAKQLMLERLESGISVTELAEACALSRSHFTRKFKESTCLPPHEWLRQQRVAKARQLLLETDMALTDIAMECGFFDQAHFCRVFLRSQGLSPQNWQRSEQAAQMARKRA